MTQCQTKRKDNFEIDGVDFPDFLYASEVGTITFRVKNKNVLIPDKMIVSLSRDGREVFRESTWLGAKAVYEHGYHVNLPRPGKYNFHLAVLDDKLLSDQCEDYQNFTITCLNEGESKTINELMEYWYLAVFGLILLFVIGMVLIK